MDIKPYRDILSTITECLKGFHDRLNEYLFVLYIETDCS